MPKFRRPLALIIAVVVAITLGAGTRVVAALSTVQLGIDRSNMATEWSIGPPAEPKIYPFTGSYNGAGVFEARRLAVLDGIARVHPAWFRDGFGADTATDAQLFVDLVSAVHARKMKILATIGFSGTDYAPQDRIPGNPAVCQWGTAPLSKINLASYAHRLRTHFDALKAAGQSPDAFEIGNELDLYCNDADMPTISEFAKHNWTWFLSDAQVHAWVAGYAPVLKTAATLIREYFPQALVITGGMSNPTGNSAPLIAALAHFTDSSGRTFDYTTLVDGYGTHIYPPADTTLHLVQHASSDLIAQAADLPHLAEKPLWITEWSENGSAFWSSHKWYFQYDSRGNIGGDLNLAQAPYGPMTRAQAIRTFTTGVIERLHAQANIGYAFYYSYDSVGKSPMCDRTAFNASRNIVGECYGGLIDPTNGTLLPGIAAALQP